MGSKPVPHSEIEHPLAHLGRSAHIDPSGGRPASGAGIDCQPSGHGLDAAAAWRHH